MASEVESYKSELISLISVKYTFIPLFLDSGNSVSINSLISYSLFCSEIPYFSLFPIYSAVWPHLVTAMAICYQSYSPKLSSNTFNILKILASNRGSSPFKVNTSKYIWSSYLRKSMIFCILEQSLSTAWFRPGVSITWTGNLSYPKIFPLFDRVVWVTGLTPLATKNG